MNEFCKQCGKRRLNPDQLDDLVDLDIKQHQMNETDLLDLFADICECN